MERKIKKIIVAFFILMLFFTIVSRAAASVTVAKVQVDKISSGRLSYQLSGVGVIKENARKYIDLHSGYIVGEVCVTAGQEVEKGDLLFSYDTKQLEESKETLKNELKKLQLQYQKLELPGQESAPPAEVNAARMKISSLTEDLKDAMAALEIQKNDINSGKREEYETALSEWEEVTAEEQEAVRKAQRAVSDAESRLAELKKPVLRLTDLITSYQAAVLILNEEVILEARNNIFDFYYDGKYQAHLEEVSDAEEELRRTKEDLDSIITKWSLAIEWWEYLVIDKDTQQKIAEYDRERKAAERAVKDAETKLERLSQRDVLLGSALVNYRTDIEGKLDSQVNYDTLYQLLYKAADIDDAAIAAANLELDRAREDEAAVNSSWEDELNKTAGKKDELALDVTAIDNGVYDYTDDLTDYEKAVRDIGRSLDEAKLLLTQADENEKANGKNEQTREKSVELDKESLQLDIDEQNSEIDKLQSIIDAEGKVLSPAAGTVTDMELEQGILLSGREKLVIATGGYELSMTASKDDIINFAPGDELVIKSYDNRDIDSQIEYIDLPDQDGKVSFTALLPEEDCISGTSLNYEINKSSKSYSMCIPIQALRQDSNGTYVLLARSADSVLGKGNKAFRLDVTVISADTSTAAIEAQLSQEDLIITGSNKNISEGDQVRIDETE